MNQQKKRKRRQNKVLPETAVKQFALRLDGGFFKKEKMPLTNREKAIAGFAWSAGNIGQSIETMDELLKIAEILGGFDIDFVERAASGNSPSENEILKRLIDTASAMQRKNKQ